jgi:hypothetical protein
MKQTTGIRTPNSMRPKGARNAFTRAEKLRRHNEAVVRQEEHDALTTAQKLAKLDQRLGKNVGAERERSRLSKAIIVNGADSVRADALRLLEQVKNTPKQAKKTKAA